MFLSIIKGFFKIKSKCRNFTIILITFCIVLIFFLSMLNQIKNNVKAYWIDSIIGGNIITGKSDEYFDFYTPYSFDNLFSYEEFVRTQKSKAIFCPRIRTQALVENQQSTAVVLCGINPEIEQSLGDHLTISEGRVINQTGNEILLTETTASTIGVKIGDSVYITTITKDGYPSYEVLELVGYISFGNIGAIYGDNIAYVSLDTVQTMCACESYEVTEILTNLNSSSYLKGNYFFYPGRQMFSISRLINAALILLEVLFIVCFGVFLLYNVVINVKSIIEEKRREISIYLTFGSSPKMIRVKIFVELFVYSLYCFLIGIIFGIFLITLFNSLGFYSIDVATEMLMSTSRFVIKIKPEIIILIFSTLILLMFLGSVRIVFSKTEMIALNSIEKE